MAFVNAFRGLCLATGLLSVPAGADGLFVGPAGKGLVAISIEGGRASAYVCDGDDSSLSLWSRFDGAVGRNATALIGGRGHVLAWEGADPLTGRILLNGGETVAFTAAPATSGAGWWQAQGLVGNEGIRIDWIAASDGRVVGSMQRGATTSSIRDGTSNTVRDGTSNMFRRAQDEGQIVIDGVPLGVTAVQ